MKKDKENGSFSKVEKEFRKTDLETVKRLRRQREKRKFYEEVLR